MWWNSTPVKLLEFGTFNNSNRSITREMESILWSDCWHFESSSQQSNADDGNIHAMDYGGASNVYLRTLDRARKSSSSPPVHSAITNLQPKFIHSNSTRTQRSMFWNSNFSTLRNCLCARIGFGAGWWRFKLTAVNFTVFFSRFFCVELVLNKTEKRF